MQMVNRGTLDGGIRFSRKGGRASGDYNTGLGNTLLMLGMCSVSMRELVAGTRWDVLADGDNCLLFYEQSVEEVLLKQLPDKFLDFGHEITVEEPTSEMERVTFGQSRPVCVDGSWQMVRDPMKAISCMAVGHRHYSELKGGLRVLKSVAQCELALNSGVPVIQSYAVSLLRDLETVKHASANVDLGDYRYEEIRRQDGWVRRREVQVSHSTRESFHRAWGVPPEEQLELEGLVVKLPRVWDGPIDGFPTGRCPEDFLRGPLEKVANSHE